MLCQCGLDFREVQFLRSIVYHFLVHWNENTTKTALLEISKFRHQCMLQFMT